MAVAAESHRDFLIPEGVKAKKHLRQRSVRPMICVYSFVVRQLYHGQKTFVNTEMSKRLLAEYNKKSTSIYKNAQKVLAKRQKDKKLLTNRVHCDKLYNVK